MRVWRFARVTSLLTMTMIGALGTPTIELDPDGRCPGSPSGSERTDSLQTASSTCTSTTSIASSIAPTTAA
jgi:hypothetical protein